MLLNSSKDVVEDLVVVAEVVTTPTDIMPSLPLTSMGVSLILAIKPHHMGASSRLRATSLVSLSGVLTMPSRPLLMLPLRFPPPTITPTIRSSRTNRSLSTRSSLRTGLLHSSILSHTKPNRHRNTGRAKLLPTAILGHREEDIPIVEATTKDSRRQ